jgi:hypothetical protein
VRERGRGNGNTSLGTIRDAGIAGYDVLIVNKYGHADMTHPKVLLSSNYCFIKYYLCKIYTFLLLLAIIRNLKIRFK